MFSDSSETPASQDYGCTMAEDRGFLFVTEFCSYQVYVIPIAGVVRTLVVRLNLKGLRNSNAH